MARTKEEILAAMLADKATRTELDGLTSTSSSSRWRVLVDLVATAIKAVEDMWDVFRAEVDALENSSIAGTARWYQQQALAYQHGHTLVWSNDLWRYLEEDTASQIISMASVTEAGNELRIKVVKDSSGPAPLSPAELTAFNAYIRRIKFAGTQVSVISNPADEINITMSVWKDPSIIDASGNLLPAGTVAVVEDAIEAYVQALPWDGRFNIQQMIDAIKAVTGVSDVVVSATEAKPYGTASFSAFTREYTPQAGWLAIATLSITYLNV